MRRLLVPEDELFRVALRPQRVAQQLGLHQCHRDPLAERRVGGRSHVPDADQSRHRQHSGDGLAVRGPLAQVREQGDGQVPDVLLVLEP